MIIEQITEENFEEKREEGTREVQKKILKFEDTIHGRGLKHPDKNVDWTLLFDPTIWAYEHLKDKQNNPLVLRSFQDKIVNDRHPFVVVAGGNQIGKTFVISVKAIHHAILVPNASVIIVSRSEPQSIMILDEIKWMMKRADVDFKPIVGEVENRTEFHIINEDKKGVSVIRCLPPTQGVYAYPATLLIGDEIAFWEIEGMKQVEYFNKVIRSRVLETKNWKHDYFTMGQIFCISSTNAQQGIMWELWNDEDFHQYRYCYLANPGNTLEEYLKAKKKFPTDEFDSVYAASFSSATGGFITEEEYNDAESEFKIEPSLTRFLGGDFAGEDTTGRDVDSSILIGADHETVDKIVKVKIQYSKEFPLRTKKVVIYEEIKIFQNLSKFAYDKVGVGDSVKADLKDRGILPEYKIESLTYSLPNKSEVYYNMKHLFEQRLIIIPKGLKKLKEQLLGLRFERTPGGYIKIHHASEGLHDDWADAFANACFAAKRLLTVTPSFTPLKTEVNPFESKSNKFMTLICPTCEKTNYNESNGYYEGVSPTGKNFAKIPCSVHLTTI